MRQSCVDAYKSPQGLWHIVCSPRNSTYTYIISLDKLTGVPFYSGIPLVDLFDDHQIATRFLMDTYQSKNLIHGEELVGISIINGISVLAIVDGTEVTGWLPGGHVIQQIKHVTYITIEEPGSTDKSPILEFQLVDNHFFCQTYDLTRPFPSEHDILDYDPDFIWNTNFSKPFRDLGLNVCIPILQGSVISSNFTSPINFSMTYIARRASCNPGTRYISRGLNEKNEPGNEAECEIIMMKGDYYWTHLWRRGSAPFRWRTILNSKVTSPSHKSEPDFNRGTPQYFQKLRDRYGAEIPIEIVSFLHCSDEGSESDLLSHFRMSIEQLDDENVHFHTFDLNHHLKDVGPIGSYTKYKEFITPILVDPLFTHLDQQLQQQQIYRFNCGDSLDRVNLGTFFHAMLLTEKWLEVNQLPQDVLDFIARAFVETGNIFSRLYTNTPAIKVEAIRKFSPNAPGGLPDLAVTLQRRVENVKNDPARNKVIETFLDPPDFDWRFTVEHTHLSICPPIRPGASPFPSSLFGPKTVYLLLDTSSCNEVTVALPAPMQLTSVQLLLPKTQFPLQSFIIMAGPTLSEMEPIIHLSIPETFGTAPFKFSLPTSAYSRFVTIRFFPMSEKFTIGNISLEGRICFESKPIPIRQTSLSANDFISRIKPNLTEREMFEIELDRVTQNVARESIDEICVSKLINPYNIRPTFPINVCAICRSEQFEDFLYSVSSVFPSLLEADSTGILHVCKKCAPLAQRSNEICQRVERKMCEPFTPVLVLPEKRGRYTRISSISTSIFSEPFSCDFTGQTSVSLYFMKVAIVGEVLIQTNDQIRMRYEQIIIDGRREGNFLVFEFKEQPMEQFFTFLLEGSGHILDISCFGVSVDPQEIVGGSIYKPLEAFTPLVRQAQEMHSWNSKLRNDDFEFLENVVINAVIFVTRGPIPTAVYVVLENASGQIVGTTRMAIPGSIEGVRFRYPIDVHEAAKRAHVYYVTPRVRPCVTFFEV